MLRPQGRSIFIEGESMDHQKLHELDGQWVRLTHFDGLVFEGRCVLDDAEYCLHEYGRAEDALNIDNWLFYGSDIRKAEVIEPGDVGVWMGKPLHRMRLDPEPFAMIDAGEKTIELRLYDEKRRSIQAGDVIRFESTADDTDVLYALVEGLRFFASFDELYRALPLTACGYTEAEAGIASPRDMDRYYSPEAQQKWGVVGIELSLL